MTPLLRAWLTLIALSMVSTMFAAAVDGQKVGSALVAVALLGLAGGKARVILRNYLDLAGSPDWMRGFTIALTVFLLSAAALRLAG